MNWKVFITACVSAAAALVPANGVTCGPSEDPHDYFTTFFSNKAGSSAVYRPFYYTALLKFYDDEDIWRQQEDSLHFVNKAVVAEWQAYGNGATQRDAINLIYLTKEEVLKALTESSKTGAAAPASLSKNTLAQNLVRSKKWEAAEYLRFAAKTEKTSTGSAWEDRRRDSLQLNQYMTEAAGFYDRTTDPFLKNKYAFQRCKLAFYNNRYSDCVRWYDEHFTDDNKSAVAELALSYKAGSLFRMGRNKEAAYAFSKAFARSDNNKRGHYTGFLWATDYANASLLPDCLLLCKTNAEKAAMTALFALHGTDYRLDAIQHVYALDPSSPLLPLLATREVHKLEEQYFTPMLHQEKGGKALYVSWQLADEKEKASEQLKSGGQQAAKTATLLEKLMRDKSVTRRSLYGAAAAYLHFMQKDYSGAKALLAAGKESAGDEEVKAQWQLINLLIAANEEKTLTSEREAQLLPAMQWLVQKAKTDGDYQLFCRNFFSQILAQKYEQQGDGAKAALAYGVSNLSFLRQDGEENWYSYPPAIDFVRNELSTEGLLKLYNLMTAPATAVEKFLVQQASFKRHEVVDVIGTSHLRAYDYAKAIEWLSKAGKLEPLIETQYNYQTNKTVTTNVDPFFDYLNDWQRFTKSLPVPYTKLTLARKLQEMEARIARPVAAEEPSRLYYQYASALYNMSYYGNSWQAVAYERSGTDWNTGDYQQSWQKEYYGVHTAKAFFQKAYDAARNKEFKAACLFMMAKCAQRQVPKPRYDYNNYEAYGKAEAAFQQKFQNNPLFARFKTEFGGTKFYSYAYSRCSYLRDYVKKSAAPARPGIKKR